jgi:hypothetical protein
VGGRQHRDRLSRAATEAVLTQVVVPLLVTVWPDLARELVDGIRTDFSVHAPTRNERLKLMTEEYLAKMADEIEARVRMKLRTDP